MAEPVLMVSCQTPEKPKTGPKKAHATTTATAAAKAVGLPAQREAAEAKREKAFWLVWFKQMKVIPLPPAPRT